MSKNFKYILIGLGLIALGFIFWYFKSIVAYIIVAAVLALIGGPLVDLICKIKIKKFQIPRSLSAAITLAVLWSILLSFFRFFIPLVANQASELSKIDSTKVVKSLEGPMQSLESIFGSLPVSSGGEITLQEYVGERIASVVNISQLSDILSFITGAMGDIFIAIFSISFISFFFLKEKGLFSNSLLVFTPKGQEEKMTHVFSSTRKLLVRYFIGLGFEVLLVTILVSTGLSIVGLKFETAVVIGLFAGFMNVIPYIGPIIGAMFGIIIGIATNLHLEFYSGLLPLITYIAIVFLVIQIIDNIFFQPLIYSSSVNAHPLEIFLVISIAGSIAGITGMVVAVPVYTILRVIAREFLNQFKVVQALTDNIE